MTVKDKGIVITGGASGLGLGNVETAGEAGARVAIVDLNKDALDACVHELRRPAHDVHGIVGDIVPKKEAYRTLRAGGAHSSGASTVSSIAPASIRAGQFSRSTTKTGISTGRSMCAALTT